MRPISETLERFLRFPEIDVAGLLRGRRPLILAPHPDDESLGCGGLIAAACEAGLTPVVVMLTDGAASHPGSRQYPPYRLKILREQEALHAALMLGLPAQNLHFLRAPDGKLPESGAAFEKYVAACGRLGSAQGCGMVFAPWLGDPHCDHQAAAQVGAALSASFGWALASYPIWGWLRDGADLFDEPRQGWRLDISPQRTRKQAAIAAHQSQLGGVIKDAPSGFQIPDALLAISQRPFEVYLQ